MDIKGLKTLNHIGTFVFRILGCVIPLFILIRFFIYDRDSYIFLTVVLLTNIWIIAVLILAELLYRNTVVGLEHGNYGSAKTWTLIGIFLGFIAGIVPFLIFIISYVSFDDAVRTKHFSNLNSKYPQQIIQIKNCYNCKRKIPFDSRLCSYCGSPQAPARQNTNPQPQSSEREIKS
jgi:hypothetical protein